VLAAERPCIPLDMRDKSLDTERREMLNVSCVGGVGTDVRNHWPYAREETEISSIVYFMI
jgi:hypothetical protein